jgi:hypothetical protein
MIYNYLLLTIKLAYFLSVRFMQMERKINTEYSMSKSVSQPVSTREPYIPPRTAGRMGGIGRGLIRHVIKFERGSNSIQIET